MIFKKITIFIGFIILLVLIGCGKGSDNIKELPTIKPVEKEIDKPVEGKKNDSINEKIGEVISKNDEDNKNDKESLINIEENYCITDYCIIDNCINDNKNECSMFIEGMQEILTNKLNKKYEKYNCISFVNNMDNLGSIICNKIIK